MSQKIQIRRGTDSERLSVTLDNGEPCWAVDTKKFYIGDGSTVGGIYVVGGTGMVFTTGDQSINGVKTFNNSILAHDISGLFITGKNIVSKSSISGVNISGINLVSTNINAGTISTTTLTVGGNDVVTTEGTQLINGSKGFSSLKFLLGYQYNSTNYEFVAIGGSNLANASGKMYNVSLAGGYIYDYSMRLARTTLHENAVDYGTGFALFHKTATLFNNNVLQVLGKTTISSYVSGYSADANIIASGSNVYVLAGGSHADTWTGMLQILKMPMEQNFPV